MAMAAKGAPGQLCPSQRLSSGCGSHIGFLIFLLNKGLLHVTLLQAFRPAPAPWLPLGYWERKGATQGGVSPWHEGTRSQ